MLLNCGVGESLGLQEDPTSPGSLGRPTGMVQGGKREEGSGWGARVYLWRIHVDIWQNQYNTVKFKKKVKKKKKSNQSILKEISPGCSLEGLMLKLKLQYFGHLMRELTHLRRLWCWERFEGGRRGDDRGWDGGWHHWLNGLGFGWTPGWWWTGRPGVLWFMGSQKVGHDWVTELNWTESCMAYLKVAKRVERVLITRKKNCNYVQWQLLELLIWSFCNTYK